MEIVDTVFSVGRRTARRIGSRILCIVFISSLNYNGHGRRYRQQSVYVLGRLEKPEFILSAGVVGEYAHETGHIG